MVIRTINQLQLEAKKAVSVFQSNSHDWADELTLYVVIKYWVNNSRVTIT